MALSPTQLPGQPNDTEPGWSPKGLFTLVFLGLAAGLQIGDMGLQAVLLAAIQKSFAVSDASLGALQGLAGVLIGSALALPLARLADRFARKRVLLCLIAASSALTALGALAQTFPLFFIGRSAAGIIEFAMVPLVYSMIPDLAPKQHRVAANLSFAALMAMGVSSGFYFSADIVTAAQNLFAWDLEPWRKAFLFMALLGLPLLLLGQLTLDPPRRLDPSDDSTSPSLILFLRRRWLAIGLFAGTGGCLLVAVQAVGQLAALALERKFHAESGDIGRAMGLIILGTSLACLPFAGWLDRLLAPRLAQAARPLIMGTAVTAALPVLVLLNLAPTLNQAFIVMGVFAFLTSTANALVPTMLQDLTPALLRARCFAWWSLVVSLFGACGPLLAGALSDWVFQQHLLGAIVATAMPVLALSALCAQRAFVLARQQQLSAAHPVAAAVAH